MVSKIRNEFIKMCGGEKPGQEREFCSKLWKDKNRLIQFFKDCYFEIDKSLTVEDNFYKEMCLYHRTRIKWIMENLLPKHNEVILDLGCGIGGITYNILQYTKNVIGIDISDESLRFANQIFKSYRLDNNLIKADAFSLPFKDDKFDKVVAADIFEHFTYEEKKKSINEILRVLKKD